MFINIFKVFSIQILSPVKGNSIDTKERVYEERYIFI